MLHFYSLSGLWDRIYAMVREGEAHLSIKQMEKSNGTKGYLVTGREHSQGLPFLVVTH